MSAESAAVAQPESAEPAPEPTPEESRVLRHLLFHKSLIGEGGDAERVNQYMAMVKASHEGAHLIMVNPFDRAIALCFQLVTEQHLDPWRLDLVQFTELYLQHVRKQGEVDLITAGRLIFMAWSVLKLQSDRAVEHAEASRKLPEPEPESLAWDDIPADGWLTEDGSYAFTTAVLQGPAPIDEKVRHKGDRKVTLYELVEAFEEARREAETRIVLDAKRREARAVWARESKAGVQGAAHKDDLEAEIREVWARIAKLNGHPIPLRSVHADTRDDLVKALVSVLFLARESHVKLWQDDFPYGPIFLQNLHPGTTPDELALPSLQPGMEPMRAEVAPRARKGRNGGKKARKAVQVMPVQAQLQVAARVATFLAALLPEEVHHG